MDNQKRFMGTNAFNSLDQIKTTLLNFILLKGVDVFAAVAMFIVGLLVARWVGRMLQQTLDKRDLEPPVKTLLVRIARLLVMMFISVMVLQQLGVPVLPMLAGISVIGVGVGFAMQGLLSNLIAGLMIILIKPFRVGEYIEIVGVYGQVFSIDLFSTKLVHADQSRVIVPNRKLLGEILHNYGHMRQAEINVGVAYSTDTGVALAAIREILAANPRVLKEPGAAVGISYLGDSAINISVKPWVKVGDFGPAQGEIYETILKTFRERSIEIPFPQREVRLLNQPDAR
jgi:small conductance mechanosensitive channel